MEIATTEQRRAWFRASNVVDSVADDVLTGYPSTIEIVRAAYVANGGRVDTSSVIRYERKRSITAWRAGLIAIAGLSVPAVRWWRWFAARTAG